MLKVIAACGNGMGSSQIIKMKIEKIFKKLNIKIDVNPVSSDEYNSVAKRPKNSRLSKEKLIKSGFEKLPTWQDAIERYLEELSYL